MTLHIGFPRSMSSTKGTSGRHGAPFSRMSVMTTSAALPPTGDAVTATASLSRTRTAAGESTLRDSELARAEIAAMQAKAMTGVIDSMSTAPAGSTPATAAERAREREAQRAERAERVPDSTKADPTDATTARARAAEAELRAETAAYDGVRQAIANSGAAADRASERRAAARQAESASVDEPDDRRRRGVRAGRERAAEAVALARIEAARAGVAAAAEQAQAAAAEDVRRANELAAQVAQENARQSGVRALDVAARRLDPEIAAAVVELARIVGGVTEADAQGRLTVKVGDRALVDRGGVHALELRQVTGDAAADTDRGRAAVVWPNRRVADIGGALAGRLSAANTLLPQVSLVVDEIATVARAEAALAAGTLVSEGATTPPPADPVSAVSPAPAPDPATASAADATGSPGAAVPSAIVVPTASDLLDELGASLTAATVESARRQDVASAVAAIAAGPPAAFFAAVVAAAGETAPAQPVQIVQRASQQLISDLQQLTGAVETALHSAQGLAENTPFVPVRVTSSDPALVRVDTPWPSAGSMTGSVTRTMAGSVTGVNEAAETATVTTATTAAATATGETAGTAAFDPDAIVDPLTLQLSVVSVAHGDVVMSRGGVRAGQDLTGGQPLPLVLGTSAPAAQPGEAPGAARVIGEVTVGAPATLQAVADAVNALAAETGNGVSAGVQTGPKGLAHLIMESGDGSAWAAARLPDGTARDILGGFTLLAPHTDSLAVATGTGLAWTGISQDRSIDGPLPGLGLTLQPGSEGHQVGLTITPATGEVTDSVDALVSSVRDVLVAAGVAEPAAEASALSATSPTAAAATAAAGAGQAVNTGTGVEADIAATHAGPNPAGSVDGTPGAPVSMPTPSGTATATPEAMQAATPAASAPAVTGVAAAPANSAATPAADPAIMDLAAAFAAAISGVGTSGGATGATGASTALASGAGTNLIPGVSAIPGLSVDVAESGRRRLAFDREAFARALADEPSGTRNAVRAVAAEVAAVAKEPLDGRVGLLAVRLHTELTAAREIDVRSNPPEWGREQREIEAARRSDALSALLDRLDAESEWLGRHLS